LKVWALFGTVEYASEFFKMYAKVHWFPGQAGRKLDVCVNSAKNVTDDAIECFWCKEWEHRSCANTKTMNMFYLMWLQITSYLCSSSCLPQLPILL